MTAIYIWVYVCVYVCIYIYRERERARERYICIYIYIYTYTYVDRYSNLLDPTFTALEPEGLAEAGALPCLNKKLGCCLCKGRIRKGGSCQQFT